MTRNHLQLWRPSDVRWPDLSHCQPLSFAGCFCKLEKSRVSRGLGVPPQALKNISILASNFAMLCNEQFHIAIPRKPPATGCYLTSGWHFQSAVQVGRVCLPIGVNRTHWSVRPLCYCQSWRRCWRLFSRCRWCFSHLWPARDSCGYSQFDGGRSGTHATNITKHKTSYMELYNSTPKVEAHRKES